MGVKFKNTHTSQFCLNWLCHCHFQPKAAAKQSACFCWWPQLCVSWGCQLAFPLLPGVAERGCIPLLVLPLGLINLKLVEHKIPRGLAFCLLSSPVSCTVSSPVTCRTPGPCFGPNGQGLLLATTYLEVPNIELFSSLCSCTLEFKRFLQVWCERDFILDLPAIVWSIMFQNIKRGTGGCLVSFLLFLFSLPSSLFVRGNLLQPICHSHIAAKGELSLLDDLELMIWFFKKNHIHLCIFPVISLQCHWGVCNTFSRLSLILFGFLVCFYNSLTSY